MKSIIYKASRSVKISKMFGQMKVLSPSLACRVYQCPGDATSVGATQMDQIRQMTSDTCYSAGILLRSLSHLYICS